MTLREDAGKRILWIDTEIDFLRAHILFLQDHGYRVEKAESTEEGLVLFRQKSFDLVILDEQISGKEGMSAILHEIRAHNTRVPVVLVTKSEEGRLVEAAWGRVFDGCLTKPVNPVQALAVSAEALRTRAVPGNQATSAYIRDISEIKSNLLANPTPSKWAKVYFQLCKWDVELQFLSTPNIEEMHRGNKAELSKRFIAYVEDNYVGWVGRKADNPDLHHQTVKRKVLPLLQKHGKCVLVVMAGMRLGQWLHIQKMVEPLFRVENSTEWALLPSEKLFCRTALFSGRMPRDVNLEQPQLWQRLGGEADSAPYERELLKIQLRKQGIDLEDPKFIHVKNREDAGRLNSELAALEDSRLVVVVVEFTDMLDIGQRDNPLDSVPAEKEMRVRTGEWFQDSGMMEAFRVLAEGKRTVVLTSDHGTVRVEAPAEVFCQEEKSPHPRVKIGPNISCDERQALFVESPPQFGLPGEAGELAYAIAKEKFYFVYPNKFQYFVTQFKDQMVSGGLSMEEMIVPLATLIPK